MHKKLYQDKLRAEDQDLRVGKQHLICKTIGQEIHLFNQAVWKPDDNLFLDESMVLWRGRLIFRQYIKNKQYKYGVNLHELCESTNIILWTSIYSGVSYPDPHDLGQKLVQ